jgi:hypothetical protein
VGSTPSRAKPSEIKLSHRYLAAHGSWYVVASERPWTTILDDGNREVSTVDTLDHALSDLV